MARRLVPLVMKFIRKIYGGGRRRSDPQRMVPLVMTVINSSSTVFSLWSYHTAQHLGYLVMTVVYMSTNLASMVAAEPGEA